MFPPDALDVLGRALGEIGHPRRWPLTSDGKPVPLAIDQGAGRRYRLNGLAPAADQRLLKLPSFGLGPPKRPPKPRPPIRDLDRDRAQEFVEAAWQKDIWGRPLTEMAKEHAERDLGRDKRQSKTEMGRIIDNGRLVLAELGVLPWAAWPGEALPDDWWSLREFSMYMNLWLIEADLPRRFVPWADRQGELGHWLTDAATVVKLIDDALTGTVSNRPKVRH